MPQQRRVLHSLMSGETSVEPDPVIAGLTAALAVPVPTASAMPANSTATRPLTVVLRCSFILISCLSWNDPVDSVRRVSPGVQGDMLRSCVNVVTQNRTAG